MGLIYPALWDWGRQHRWKRLLSVQKRLPNTAQKTFQNLEWKPGVLIHQDAPRLRVGTEKPSELVGWILYHWYSHNNYKGPRSHQQHGSRMESPLSTLTHPLTVTESLWYENIKATWGIMAPCAQNWSTGRPAKSNFTKDVSSLAVEIKGDFVKAQHNLSHWQFCLFHMGQQRAICSQQLVVYGQNQVLSLHTSEAWKNCHLQKHI